MKPRSKGRISGVAFDCIHYRGVKPCRYSDVCPCERYTPIKTRVLIIKLAAMGDVLRTTSILHNIRKSRPDAQITWLTAKTALPVLNNIPQIHRLIPLDLDSYSSLMRESFDAVMNFDKEGAALALASGVNAGERLGFGLSPFGSLIALNAESDYALRLGICNQLKFRENEKTYPQIIHEMVRLPYNGEEYILPATESRTAASRVFRERFVEKTGPVIGLNTGAGNVFATKRWPARRFAQLANLIRLNHADAEILLLGGPEERERNPGIASEGTAKDTGCDYTIEEFISLVDVCDILVTADTLAMHIGIGLKKRVVALFGATCPQEIDLFGRGRKIIAPGDCGPCYLKQCSREISCMELLDAETVYKAVAREIE